MTTKNWKRSASAKIARLTPDEATMILSHITAETTRSGATIFHSVIRELTGGFNSQSINAYVVRRLGIRAGFIKNAS